MFALVVLVLAVAVHGAVIRSPAPQQGYYAAPAPRAEQAVRPMVYLPRVPASRYYDAAAEQVPYYAAPTTTAAPARGYYYAPSAAPAAPAYESYYAASTTTAAPVREY